MKKSWILQGLFFGLCMALTSQLIDLIDREWDFYSFLKELPVWLVGGLIFGFINHKCK